MTFRALVLGLAFCLFACVDGLGWEKSFKAGKEYEARRDFAAAEQQYRDALHKTKGLPDVHPYRHESMQSLSRVLNELGKHEEAERLRAEHCKDLERSVGEDHPWLAWALHAHGQSLYALGRVAAANAADARALGIYQHAYEFLEKQGPPLDHKGMAVVMSEMARVHHARLELDKAMAAYQTALHHFQALDEFPEEGLETLQYFAELHRSQGRRREAEQLLEAARRLPQGKQ